MLILQHSCHRLRYTKFLLVSLIFVLCNCLPSLIIAIDNFLIVHLNFYANEICKTSTDAERTCSQQNFTWDNICRNYWPYLWFHNFSVFKNFLMMLTVIQVYHLLQIALERDKVTNDPKSIMPAAFVSFKTRWGAAVCAQTQQTRNPTLWLTEWAPEPRDVYWPNLAIPYVSLTVRRLIIAVAFFFLTFFFMIPIAFVQTLASLDGIQKAAPWLEPLIRV